MIPLFLAIKVAPRLLNYYLGNSIGVTNTPTCIQACPEHLFFLESVICFLVFLFLVFVSIFN